METHRVLAKRERASVSFEILCQPSLITGAPSLRGVTGDGDHLVERNLKGAWRTSRDSASYRAMRMSANMVARSCPTHRDRATTSWTARRLGRSDDLWLTPAGRFAHHSAPLRLGPPRIQVSAQRHYTNGPT